MKEDELLKAFKKSYLCFTLAFFLMVSIIPLGSTLALACEDGGTAIIAFDLSAEMSRLLKFDWNITKNVTPKTWNLFKGDTGTSQYTVSVTKDQGTDIYTVQGNIKIINAFDSATGGLQIDVIFSDPLSKMPIIKVPVDVSSYPVISSRDSYIYAYSLNFQGILLKEYEVTDKATIINYTMKLNTPTGDSISKIVSSPLQPTTLINDKINVVDNEKSWIFSATGSTSYTRTFSSTDAGVINNTETIRENGKSASTSVTVNSYELNVAKTATPSFTRTYKWSIDKTGDQTTLTLQNGQSAAVNYNVALSATYTDSNRAYRGIITIKNPAPIPTTINSIFDIISSDIPVEITNLTLPLTLPAGGSLDLNYSSALPDLTARTYVAAVVRQIYAYNFDNTATPIETTNLAASATIDFNKAEMKEIDKNVSVTDDKYGSLGNVTYSNIINPFIYQLVIGAYAQSGTYTFTNTATFVTNDTKTTGSDSWAVTTYIDSGEGTRTIGYWKNHPEKMTGLLPIYLGINSRARTITISDTKEAAISFQ
jgi:hypothetical protein